MKPYLKPTFLLTAIILFQISVAAQSVERLALINATNNTELRDLVSTGDSIDIYINPLINFRAVTSPEPLAGGAKCVFQLSYPSGAVYNHSEGSAVYACFGDVSGDYKDWESGYNSPPAIELGDYSLKVTPGAGTPSTWLFKVYSSDTTSSGGGGGGSGPVDTIKLTDGEVLIRGEQKQWHNIEFNIGGPQVSETDTPSPFLDYRFNVTFTKGDTSLVVPGYFAADGSAAETGASEGNVWRAHLCPPSTGTWTYEVSFRTGTDVAVDENPDAGTPVAGMDGLTGSIEVSYTDKNGKDLRAKGRLQYVGEHHLQFSGSKQWFMKAGADAPENFLAYEDFDNTPNSGGYRKSWAPHIRDWRAGDATWHNDKGKGIIGAINYLSSKGMNVFSFLTMNINGDDKNVYPYISSAERSKFDCSKLDQWEIVFSHASKQGMYLHFKTQETENEMLLDNGNTNRLRKLYYRELIARFGHHLALNWNLGEENGDFGATNQNTAQRQAMAAYFAEHDPYKNHIVIHTAPNKQEEIYRPLLGANSELTGVSIQTGWANVYNESKQWVQESAAANKKWVVANDEQNSADIGVPDDAYTGTPDKNNIRKDVLWGNMMAGGAGVEYYFGYDRPESDLSCQDFRSRDISWDFAKIGLDFFNTYIPYWNMHADNSFTSNGWGLALEGEVYVVYLKNGGSSNLSLPEGSYTVKWYNPREGGELSTGSITEITGGSAKSIGSAPGSDDWVALIREENFSHEGNGTDLFPCGDALVYSSFTDFPNFNINGFDPAYKDNGNECLAIDATQYKGTFAAAATTFAGEDGIYDITLTTLTETDGESTYRVRLNGVLIGEYQNPSTTVDYEPSTILWPAISLLNGDEIQVEFNSHTNGLIAEGDGTAYSRGRWESLSFQALCTSQECLNPDAFIETDGYVVIDMESVVTPNDQWTVQTGYNSLGAGFLQYEGNDHMGAELESARLEYKVQINTPGTYQFLWRTRRGFNSVSFDGANDTWLRINGTEFYGMNGGSKIDCTDEFMKVWVQKDDFIFECFGEHAGVNGMAIYADFDEPGEYTIDVSGRSKGHVIDRIALFMDGKKSIATADATPESQLGCGGSGGGGGQDPVIIHASEVYLSYDSILIEEGDSYRLKATVLPELATDRSVSWDASDRRILGISNGLVVGQNLGEANIYVSASDGGFKDTCHVKVIPNKTKYPIEKSNMTAIYADSEDTEKGGGVKERAIDGDLATFWHTQWFSAKPSLPHELYIEFDEARQVDVIDYYPRQDEWGPNGALGKYEFYMSDDTASWGDPIAKGELRWARNATQEDYKEKKRIYLESTASGKYFRLLALSEAQYLPEVPFTAVAELDLMSYNLPEDTTGISSYINAGIKLYPNPASSTLNIESDETFNGLDIIHIDGRIMKQINLENSRRFTLDISDLNHGAYIILIKSNDIVLKNCGFLKY